MKLLYTHFPALIIRQRIDLGYTTLKKFYDILVNPVVEYRSWAHAEAGRRLPKPEAALAIGEALGINREKVVATYCKDLFKGEGIAEFLDNAAHGKTARDL